MSRGPARTREVPPCPPAGDLVNGAGMANAVAELTELVETLCQRLLVGETCLNAGQALLTIVSCSSRRSQYSSFQPEPGVLRSKAGFFLAAAWSRSLTFCWTWDGSLEASRSKASSIVTRSRSSIASTSASSSRSCGDRSKRSLMSSSSIASWIVRCRSAMKASKSSGPNGSRRRMSKAAGEMKCDSRVARTVASPFASISSGRYSFGRRSLMTFDSCRP